jgi:TRAP-type uncharacterized transport system substrate-binding protein
MAARGFLRDNGSAITISVTFAVIVIGAVIWMRLHLPPRAISMATGGRTLAYWNFGDRYRKELERDHVDVVVEETAGSLDNLALLHKPASGVSVALIQGGILNPKDSSDLESLGTVFYEPLWLFRNPGVQGEGLNGLRGKKIAIGLDGSGTQALARELLKRHGIDDKVSDLQRLPTAEASEKLLAREIDATFMVASWDAPGVQQLLHDKRVELSGYPQADTYADLYPYLHKVIVHRGVSDLANDQPPTDVVLIATKASLVVRKDLDPAIQSLLLKAAKQIHSGQTIFQRANEFPAAEAVGLPLSAAAQQFYRPDLPSFMKNFLNNYLPYWVPFWMAERINELVLFLLILVGGLSIFSPTMRPLGFLYDWTKRRKILRLYGELMFLEEELETPGGKNVAGKIAVQLEELEQQANRLKVPVAYASMLYTLRHHIELVRERLEGYAGRVVK